MIVRLLYPFMLTHLPAAEATEVREALNRAGTILSLSTVLMPEAIVLAPERWRGDRPRLIYGCPASAPGRVESHDRAVGVAALVGRQRHVIIGLAIHTKTPFVGELIIVEAEVHRHEGL